MAYKLPMTLSFPKKFSSYSVVVASFFLAFIYIIELAIGIRTVVYVFHLWNHTRASPSKLDDVSWMVVVVSLLLCVVTSCTVNAISAFWDSNQTSGVRSAIFYALHILTGGVIWRYMCLLRCESSETKKEQAMLLASLKFLFTQTFTIPLLIIHMFLLCNLYELIYDFIIICGIAASLMLICVAFDHYEQCGEYPHETMALVPLLFKTLPQNTEESSNEKPPKGNIPIERGEHIALQWKKALWKIVVGIQVFFFTFGRVLSLGILLKLAGIYGITIIFLQVLLSLLYMKFQANYLVPETLTKFKQLMRLSFLSYILVFEWQLHRDAATGYTLKSGLKHGIFYYSITTVESMFYLVFWAVTYNGKFTGDSGISLNHQHVLIITSIGCLSLLMSYAIHIFLILTNVEACPSMLTSPRKLYPRIRVILNNSLGSRGVRDSTNPVPTINISSFTDSIKETNTKENNVQDLNTSQHQLAEDQHASYQDLRESIGEEDAIRIQTSTSISRQIECVSSTKNIEVNIKEHDHYCKNGAESKPHTIRNEGVMPKLPKKGASSPNFLKRSKSTGNLSATETKDSKEFNFMKTLKKSSKILQDKQSAKQVERSSNSNVKHSNVYNKMTAVSNSLSSQFSKLANFKGIKTFSRKGEDLPKQNSLDAQINITTIMSEYKEEAALNQEEPNPNIYRPVVPPRNFRPIPKERKKKNMTKSVKSIDRSSKPNENALINSKDQLAKEMPNRRILSETGVDEKADSIPYDHKDNTLQEGDHDYHSQLGEKYETTDIVKSYPDKENGEAYISHSLGGNTFEKVHSSSLSSEDSIANQEKEDEGSCIPDNGPIEDQYNPEVEESLAYEEDVVFDANLKLGDISVSSRRIKLKSDNGGISTTVDSLEPPCYKYLKSVSETEHYV